MASQASHGADDEDGSATDLAEVWREAMLEYRKTTDQPLDALPRFRNIESVMENAQRETDLFDKYRHPGDKVDKLRTLLRNNLGHIEAGAKSIAAAATPAFPPAAIILTAIMYLLQVRHVLCEVCSGARHSLLLGF